MNTELAELREEVEAHSEINTEIKSKLKAAKSRHGSPGDTRP